MNKINEINRESVQSDDILEEDDITVESNLYQYSNHSNDISLSQDEKVEEVDSETNSINLADSKNLSIDEETIDSKSDKSKDSSENVFLEIENQTRGAGIYLEDDSSDIPKKKTADSIASLSHQSSNNLNIFIRINKTWEYKYNDNQDIPINKTHTIKYFYHAYP